MLLRGDEIDLISTWISLNLFHSDRAIPKNSVLADSWQRTGAKYNDLTIFLMM